MLGNRKIEKGKKMTIISCFFPVVCESVCIYIVLQFIFVLGRKHFALFFKVQFVSCSFTELPKHNLRENNVKIVFQIEENGLRIVRFLTVVLSSGNHVFGIYDKRLTCCI